MIKLKRLENDELKLFEFRSYEEAFDKFCIWKRNFIIENNIDGLDPMYKRFCESLDSILDSFEVSDRCNKCCEEDHKNDFCRCESRNIRLARKKRNMLKVNRAEDESHRERLSEKTP